MDSPISQLPNVGVVSPLSLVPIVQDGVTSKATVSQLTQGVASVFVSSVQLADFASLRASDGTSQAIYITGYLGTAVPSGIAGPFTLDPHDNTTPDDGGMCIVTVGGARYKRQFDGFFIDPEWYGADPLGLVDSYPAGQKACNYASSHGRLTVRWGVGSFKISATIWTCDVTAAVGATGCAMIGAGEFATRFIPSGDFTVFKFVAGYVESGGFSVEWPLTASAAIPAARIGVEFADANYQLSYATIRNITVMYAYRGYVLKDWTGSTYGTVFLTTLSKLTAFRCADWGFNLSSKTGSTTLRMLQCYVRGDSSAGGQYGKGIYATNFTDVILEQPAIDQCLDSWISLINYNTATLNGIALEANKMGSAGATAILLQGSHTAVRGIKTISCTYDTSGNARVIYAGASCILTLSGYNEQANTVAAGTTRYKLAFNAAGTDVSILDRSVLSADILDNGWYHSVVYQGVRRSRTGAAPSYGTWIVGDYTKNGASAVGQPKGWQCTVAGAPGTWVSEGNL